MSNGMHAVKKDLSQSPLDEVKAAAQEAAVTVEKASKAVVKSAKANPAIAAAMLVGGGALLGALLSRVLWPAPTASEVLYRALKNGADDARGSVLAGLASARRAIR